eukprot:403347149
MADNSIKSNTNQPPQQQITTQQQLLTQNQTQPNAQQLPLNQSINQQQNVVTNLQTSNTQGSTLNSNQTQPQQQQLIQASNNTGTIQNQAVQNLGQTQEKALQQQTQQISQQKPITQTGTIGTNQTQTTSTSQTSATLNNQQQQNLSQTNQQKPAQIEETKQSTVLNNTFQQQQQVQPKINPTNTTTSQQLQNTLPTINNTIQANQSTNQVNATIQQNANIKIGEKSAGSINNQQNTTTTTTIPQLNTQQAQNQNSQLSQLKPSPTKQQSPKTSIVAEKCSFCSMIMDSTRRMRIPLESCTHFICLDCYVKNQVNDISKLICPSCNIAIRIGAQIVNRELPKLLEQAQSSFIDCSYHPGVQVDQFCFESQELVCAQCSRTNISHASHDHQKNLTWADISGYLKKCSEILNKNRNLLLNLNNKILEFNPQKSKKKLDSNGSTLDEIQFLIQKIKKQKTMQVQSQVKDISLNFDQNSSFNPDNRVKFRKFLQSTDQNLSQLQDLNQKLLFWGRRDGFTAEVFHDICDGIQGPIVTIIKAEGGQIHGAYSSLGIKSSQQLISMKDQQAFTFSLTQNEVIKTYQKDEKSVSFWQHSILMFGGGLDLCLFDRCDESYDNIISLPIPQFDLTQPKTYQQLRFKVLDIEVYRISLPQQSQVTNLSAPNPTVQTGTLTGAATNAQNNGAIKTLSNSTNQTTINQLNIPTANNGTTNSFITPQKKQ